MSLYRTNRHGAAKSFRQGRQGRKHTPSPRKRLLGLELLEDRTLLSAAVATDLVNYTPGGTALITATGFQPGETVQFQVLHTDGTANTGANEAPWQVADTSGAGNLQTSWNLDLADTGSFEVIAVGQTSGAVATSVFSDSTAYPNPIAPPAASVATDQNDYAPGSTAVINAGGFQPGETVQFQVLHTDGSSNAGADHAPWQVTDGSSADQDGTVNGNVQTSWYVDPSDNAGASLRVLAIGQTSGAVATEDFTDAGSLTSISPTSSPEGAGFTLTATGTGFTSTNRIVFNGSTLTTTFVNSTTLRPTVAASLVPDETTTAITVTVSGATGSATFTVTENDSLTVTGSTFTPTVGPPLVIST
jgi:hypothetical protein